MDDADAAKLLSALADPLRIDMVRALRDRRILSSIEPSRDTGEPLEDILHHVRVLQEAGVLALADEVSGGTEQRLFLTGPHLGAALGILDFVRVS